MFVACVCTPPGESQRKTVVENAQVILAVDLPVELGCVQYFVAGAGNGAKIGEQAASCVE